MTSIRIKISLTLAAVIILVSILTGLITSIIMFNFFTPYSEEMGNKIVNARADEMAKLLEGLKNEVITISKRNVIKTGDWAVIKPDLLSRGKDLNKYFEMILFSDLSGNFFTSQGNSGNISDRKYFQEIIIGGKETAISQPVVSKASGKKIIVIAAVVKNNKGEKIGLAAATIVLETIEAITREAKISAGGQECIVNQGASIVTFSDPSKEMKTLEDAGFKDLMNNLGKINKLKNGSLELNGFSSKKEIVNFTEIKNSPDWTLIVSIPKTEITQKIINLSIVIVFVTLGIGLFIAILSGFLFGTKISIPILNITKNISEAAKYVEIASGELSASSHELAKANSEQASFISETSATLEETSSMIRRNYETTFEASKLAQKAREASSSGNVQILEMIEAINELKSSSDQISDIIKLINEIALQTNILALNAAFEAARAGEAGRSFAVVADEVRELAQKSSQASKDIENIIGKNIKLSGKNVIVAQKVEQAFKEITTHSIKVSELINEISQGSQEQSIGIQQINEAVLHIDNITQQNAAASEQSAAASQVFKDQAVNLSVIISQLKKIVNGKE